MSYRTIKRLLGETSLERKCRFLFGSGLLILITFSFYFYARVTTSLVYDQNTVTARLLVPTIILERHWKWSEGNDTGFDRVIGEMMASLKPEDLEDYSWTLLKADLNDPAGRPFDEAGYEALERLRTGEDEVVRVDPKSGQYQFYGAVRAADTCIRCHRYRNPDVASGDLIGMTKISLPLDRTEKALAWNNAFLLVAAMVTAFLAMAGAYGIVRYVIVKPVLHLKDVSDAVARGNLEQRADIRTGDEFEELSHAFNRMLRHLVNTQEELRHVNADLDSKVDELAQVNLRLYDLNNIKNEFLATMSHELRTPLNSILGFSDVLYAAPNLNDKQRRYVTNIQTSGKHLLSLINDVLDLAKIESGKMELHPVEFSLADLTERMVGSMLPLAEKKNTALSWEVDPGLPIAFQDSGKLQQILSNLLSNAIKFTPEGGRVRVAVTATGPNLFELVVEDTGIGIPLDEQERIFEKFRQGKSVPGQGTAITREYEGTGLGLSIIRELSKLMGGEVSLQSEFGKGSVFTVTLPVRLTEAMLRRSNAAGAPKLHRPDDEASVA